MKARHMPLASIAGLLLCLLTLVVTSGATNSGFSKQQTGRMLINIDMPPSSASAQAQRESPKATSPSKAKAAPSVPKVKPTKPRATTQPTTSQSPVAGPEPLVTSPITPVEPTTTSTTEGIPR